MTSPGPDDQVERLGELLRRGAESAVNEADDRLLRAQFIERAEAELPHAGRRFRPWMFALPALAAALAVAVFLVTPRSLTFQVEGARADGSYVSAPNHRPVTLRFSDSTTVLASAGSRLRVEAEESRSVRVLVERGRAEAHVVHAALRQWTFVAGPFEVLVTGTRFVLEWDPVRESIELTLHEGSVEVRGPTGSGPVPVRAGERFHGDALKKSLLVSRPEAETPATVPAPTSDVLPPPPAAAPQAAPEKASREPKAERPPQVSWQERITRGEFSLIVSEAEGRGVSQCLSSCSADDLRALSDAARYSGKSDLAEQSLLSLRKRFAGGAGRDAAFLLGRLSEQRGATEGAERWYDTYLRESPGGAFAAEALAGTMRTVRKLRGSAAAAPLARDYLKRFPKGVHVATAREILGTDSL